MTPEVPYPLHKAEPPVTYVERQSRTRRRWGLVVLIIMLLVSCRELLSVSHSNVASA